MLNLKPIATRIQTINFQTLSLISIVIIVVVNNGCKKVKSFDSKDTLSVLCPDILILSNTNRNIKSIFEIRGNDTINKYGFNNQHQLIYKSNKRSNQDYSSVNLSYENNNEVIASYNGDVKYSLRYMFRPEAVYIIDKADTTYVIQMEFTDGDYKKMKVNDIVNKSISHRSFKYSNDKLIEFTNKNVVYKRLIDVGFLKKNGEEEKYYYNKQNMVDSIIVNGNRSIISYNFW